MNFDEKYVGVAVNSQPVGEDVFCSDRAEECFHCHKLTRWVSLSFEASVCSEECENSEWIAYYATLKKSEAKI